MVKILGFEVNIDNTENIPYKCIICGKVLSHNNFICKECDNEPNNLCWNI